MWAVQQKCAKKWNKSFSAAEFKNISSREIELHVTVLFIMPTCLVEGAHHSETRSTSPFWPMFMFTFTHGIVGYIKQYTDCARWWILFIASLVVTVKLNGELGGVVKIQHLFWFTRCANRILTEYVSLRWPYCLTIIGRNFVSNDLLHQTLISYNGPWFTFPFMHIWWHHNDIIRF